MLSNQNTNKQSPQTETDVTDMEEKVKLTSACVEERHKENTEREKMK